MLNSAWFVLHIALLCSFVLFFCASSFFCMLVLRLAFFCSEKTKCSNLKWTRNWIFSISKKGNSSLLKILIKFSFRNRFLLSKLLRMKIFNSIFLAKYAMIVFKVEKKLDMYSKTTATHSMYPGLCFFSSWGPSWTCSCRAANVIASASLTGYWPFKIPSRD